jgi:hypothetical protein
MPFIRADYISSQITSASLDYWFAEKKKALEVPSQDYWF